MLKTFTIKQQKNLKNLFNNCFSYPKVSAYIQTIIMLQVPDESERK